MVLWNSVCDVELPYTGLIISLCVSLYPGLVPCSLFNSLVFTGISVGFNIITSISWFISIFCFNSIS